MLQPTTIGTTFRFDAIGTQWEIETPEPLERTLQQRILARIEQFDLAYSRFRPDSVIARVAAARAGGSFQFPDDAEPLFTLYDRLHSATEGAVDPLVGRDLELLGYDLTYSLTPAPDAVRAAADAHGRGSWARDVIRRGTTLTTQRNWVIDLGAAGKGYLVDLVAELLRAAGISAFIVDAGGDLVQAGEAPLPVGLEHPFDPRLVVGIANVQSQALCASAVNRRAWGDGLHHVLDARTGLPVRAVVATWVVARDAATADGLATALFFSGAERLAADFEFSFVRMFADGRAEITPDFPGELFS